LHLLFALQKMLHPLFAVPFPAQPRIWPAPPENSRPYKETPPRPAGQSGATVLFPSSHLFSALAVGSICNKDGYGFACCRTKDALCIPAIMPSCTALATWAMPGVQSPQAYKPGTVVSIRSLTWI